MSQLTPSGMLSSDVELAGAFIGNDLVHLPSFALRLKPSFLQRAFTEDEIAYAEGFATPPLRFASTWAAKESIYKALKQAGAETPKNWRDIEVRRDRPAGTPRVFIRGKETLIGLSISHDGDYVWAVATLPRVSTNDNDIGRTNDLS